MKAAFRFSIAIGLVLSLFLWKTTYSQPPEADDRTLSPYFFLNSDENGLDQLPLKSTTADVRIAGVIADVAVTQVYRNEGKRPLEALYVFPASTRAAVYGMKMTIGERVIEAKIGKRDEARQQYERARDQGKSASLLEQQRPNVFQMNVANIMPGDEIKVELKYTELIVPTEGIYEFAYPTVSGPRYSNQSADKAPPSESWSRNPYFRQGQAPSYSFDIRVAIASPLPIRDVACSSHKVKTTFKGPSAVDVALDPAETTGGNRDYILHYRLDGNRIQSGLLLSESEKGNFFLMMMQPPRRVTKADIPGREYIFIVDVSGSMHGFPLDISKKLLSNLISGLRRSDRFNVLLFAGGSSLLSESSLPATSENVARAIQTIENQRGGGGTELLPALKRALSLERPENFSRTVVMVTDGYVTVEEEAFDLIRNSLGQANMFAFGIGTSVNRHLIEGMAHVGMGEPFVITKPEEASAKAERFRRLIASPVLTQAKVSFDGFQVYDVEPLSIPDVLADRPVIVFGKWKGKARGAITLTGISGEGRHSETIDVGRVRPAEENDVLRYLWARHRITILSDYNKLHSDEDRVREVTDLGLTYNLLTAYTSFVAIDSEVRNRGGGPAQVKQPLPLPQGVSDYAVGGFGALKNFAAQPMMARNAAAAPYLDKVARERQVIKEEEKRKATVLTVGDIVLSEGLPRHTILKVVKSHAREMEACIGSGQPSGKFTVILTIGADGTVKNVQIPASTLIDQKTRQCLAEKIRQWRFGLTRGGREVNATITLYILS
ncbi:MAG: VWA domain-containing protein [Deltaproteobacteria bacterium]|nr:VWA domain-containing protein [Deltaproteobacteria bacterium]